MDSSTTDYSLGLKAPDWASQLGYRLKALCLEHAEEKVEQRASRLELEIRRALQVVPIADREKHLEVLADFFPSWKEASAAVYAAKPVEPSAEEILNSFYELLPGLNEEQRTELKEKLAANGISSSGGGGLDGEVLAEIQTKLKMKPTDEIDPQRLGKLFTAFTELTFVLDQLVWNVWKNAAPKSAMKRDTTVGDLRGLVRKSLTGDAEVSATQVQQQLEITRQLIAGLLAGLGSAGQEFAHRYHERFAPEAIRASLSGEGGAGFFGSSEAKCWKKYTEVAAELNEESIGAEIRESVVKYAEDLIRGRNR